VGSLGFEPRIANAPGFIDWSEYKVILSKKYVPKYVNMQLNNAKKYHDCLRDPSRLLTLSPSVRSNVLKALICLSKYLGTYLSFREIIKQYGIRWDRTDSLESFMHIMSSNHSDLPEWMTKACTSLSDHERLYLRFLILSGLRVSEGILSFNLIIELSKNSKLNEYYNEELEILEHYRYKQFLRNSKNAYVTVISKELITLIAKSKPVHYMTIRKHLAKIKLSSRFKELRQQYATFMVRHGLIREEVDLLQGRVPKSIFIRHYWSPSFKELKERTLEGIKQMEQTICF
jgi:hypothetical protein